MKINFVNSDHIHALIDLPTDKSIEDIFQVFKGSSSHWINQNNIIPGKFSWAEDRQHFRFLIQKLIKWRNISPTRRIIIGLKASLKNMSHLLKNMDLLYPERINQWKAVETACELFIVCVFTGINPSVNEK